LRDSYRLYGMERASQVICPMVPRVFSGGDKNQIHLMHERAVYEKINVNYHNRHYVYFIDM
jgi:hypothetical protein